MRNRLFNYNVAFRTALNKLKAVLKRIYYVNARNVGKRKSDSRNESLCFADYKDVLSSLYDVIRIAPIFILFFWITLPVNGKNNKDEKQTMSFDKVERYSRCPQPLRQILKRR